MNMAEKDTRRMTESLYQEDLKHIPGPIAEVLEIYSGIPKDRQKQHILSLRNQAYKAHPYPCLGRFRFLELDLSVHPLYQEYVVPKLKGNDTEPEPLFLDLGTCLGQDIRKLIHDGVSPSRLYGSDIVPEFIDAGYELFLDGDKFPRDHFICPADVFDKSEKGRLSVLDGKVDILQASAVFHLFSGEQQAAVAERCMKLVRKESGSRSLVLGGQVGNVNEMESVRADGSRKYRHDEKSWRTLWEQTAKQDQFNNVVKKVEVEVNMQQRTSMQVEAGEQQKYIGLSEEGFRWMVWQVWVEC